MPTPQEQAAEKPAEAAGEAEPAETAEAPEAPGTGEAAEDTGATDTGAADTGAPGSTSTPDPASVPANRAATTSLIAGILGVTGIGVLLGLGFGAVGLARSRRVHLGKARAWTGIIASLLWVGAFIYVVPHVVKAADPGCTAFKEKVLPHYNQAIEDLNARPATNKTTSDLGTAVAGLVSATAKSKNPQTKAALRKLTGQLKTASTDQIAGRIPAPVMLTLNHDAIAADNACGTI